MENNTITAIPNALPHRYVDIFRSREALLLGLLIIVAGVNSLLSPYFLDIYNLFDSTQIV